jgi:hypothetical protein
MLQRSSFVRAAVGKPWHTYAVTLAHCSPLHWAALLGAGVLVVRVLPVLWTVLWYNRARTSTDKSLAGVQTSANRLLLLPILALAVWPVGFFVALTLLGSLGSGFQSRFLMPMLPGSALLTAVLLDLVQRTVDMCGGYMRLLASACDTVVTLIAAYSAMHVFYYAVLYAPLFADLDVSMIDVLTGILQSPYQAPESREAFQSTLRFMAHYGLDRQSR